MKTFYTLFGLLFGVFAAHTFGFGILGHMWIERISSTEAAYRFITIFLPTFIASLILLRKAKQFDWENDLFFLTLKLITKKAITFMILLNKKADETKDKIKDDLKE